MVMNDEQSFFSPIALAIPAPPPSLYATPPSLAVEKVKVQMLKSTEMK